MSLTKEVSDLVADAEFASVFGIEHVNERLMYTQAGATWEVTVG